MEEKGVGGEGSRKYKAKFNRIPQLAIQAFLELELTSGKEN